MSNKYDKEWLKLAKETVKVFAIGGTIMALSVLVNHYHNSSKEYKELYQNEIEINDSLKRVYQSKLEKLTK